jgi:acetolactate synthase-1/2/3 large subunit
LNGAESLVKTAAASGVRICFANPGTTELPLVAALDSAPGIRPVLCLFEGVCSGAADGYARMSGDPAMTLLHLGPGFANGIANFHNARRARSAIFNVIGEHASWHRAADPPLASDIVSLAEPVSGWLRSAESSANLGRDTAEAIGAARSGIVATLIAPQDVQLGEPASVGAAREALVAQRGAPQQPAAVPLGSRVEQSARLLRGRGRTALLLGADALSARGLGAAGRIAAASDSRLWCDTFPARLERGGDLPRVERLPYFPEEAIEALSGYSAIVLAGTASPVSFFGYPGLPSQIIGDDCETIALTEPTEAAATALESLAEALGGASRATASAKAPPLFDRPHGALTPERIAAVLAALQPEGAIVMDEGLTSGLAYFDAAATSPPHSYLALTGGAIGQGLPCATGAAIACPDRPVIALQADGSGMYTLQALWTQARESLDVTNVILANRGYQILAIELARAGVSEPGPQAEAMTRFDPVPDWTQLARGFDVPAVRVSDAEGLWKEFERAIAEPGPHLIEALL